MQTRQKAIKRFDSIRLINAHYISFLHVPLSKLCAESEVITKCDTDIVYTSEKCEPREKVEIGIEDSFFATVNRCGNFIDRVLDESNCYDPESHYDG